MDAKRIDDGRQAYICRPKEEPEEKLLAQLQRKPMRRVSKELAKDKRANDQMQTAFLRYNEFCACGCGEYADCWHHIASGTAGKAATRFDTDLTLPSTQFCNSADVFHDQLVWPKARQLAAKFMLIFHKFNRASAKRTTLEEIVSWLPVDLAKVAEIIAKRKGES